MVNTTTIRISQKTKSIMDKIKIHPRETYEDIILRLINITKEVKK